MRRKSPKALIWITLGIAILLFGIGLVVCIVQKEEGVKLEVGDQPTIGYAKAAVHVVVFEEPKCIDCKHFNESIYPLIKKKYIDTNKIRYTVIPVSFLQGSMPAAVALYCAYYQDPVYPNSEVFFTYLDYLFTHQPTEASDWATPEKLLEMAQDSSKAIQPDQLKGCIDKQTYRIRVEKNNAYGRKLMNGSLVTPTVYVDGIRVEKLSANSVERLIKKQLKRKGVH